MADVGPGMTVGAVGAVVVPRSLVKRSGGSGVGEIIGEGVRVGEGVLVIVSEDIIVSRPDSSRNAPCSFSRANGRVMVKGVVKKASLMKDCSSASCVILVLACLTQVEAGTVGDPVPGGSNSGAPSEQMFSSAFPSAAERTCAEGGCLERVDGRVLEGRGRVLVHEAGLDGRRAANVAT